VREREKKKKKKERGLTTKDWKVYSTIGSIKG
jgi:hypothetical protein